MTRPDSLLKVGVVTSAHGIRGEVKIHSLTSDPEDIFSYGVLTDAKGIKQFKLKLQGHKEKQFIVSVDGVKDRNAAELLKGMEFYAKVKADSIPAALTGLAAKLADGQLYGTVIGVYNFGAGEVIDIKLVDGKTEMLPLQPQFVDKKYTAKGYIVITPPEYLETGLENE